MKMSGNTDNNNNNNNNKKKHESSTPNLNTNTTSTYNSNVFSPVQSFDISSTAATTPRAPQQKQQHQQQSRTFLNGVQLSKISHGFVPRLGISRPNSHSSLNVNDTSRNFNIRTIEENSKRSHSNHVMKNELLDDSSSLSDLSMMEDAIKWYDANDDPNVNTIDKASEAGSNSRSMSLFKEMDDLTPSSNQSVSNKEKNRGTSINKILEIYTETSQIDEISRRDSLYSSKENSLYFGPSSSSSLMNYPRKLDTKMHSKVPNDHIKDQINDSNQTSEDSENISLSNIYKNDSTVSTLELLNSLINDQPMSSPPIAKRSSSRYTTRYGNDFRESLTNVLETDYSSQQHKEFRTPLAPLNPVFKARSPPQSVVSTASGRFSNYGSSSKQQQQQQQHRINIYNFQQQWQQQPSTQYTLSEQPSEDNFIPVKPAIHNSSSNDSLNVSIEKPTDSFLNNKESSKFTESTDSFQFEPVFLRNGDEDEAFCSQKTSRLLIIFSLLIPPFYLLLALGVLDHKIGKIDRRHRLIAGICSIFGTLLILLAIGLGFGYGLTHP